MSITYRYQPQPQNFASFPKVIKALLVANIAIFGLQVLLQMAAPGLADWFLRTFALWPSVRYPIPLGNGEVVGINYFRLWQYLTYGFLHGGPTHLLFNMFGLWMFGTVIERAWGSKRFLAYYLVCVVGAALMQHLVWDYFQTPQRPIPTVGASGGLFGLLLAFGLMFPNQRLLILFLPFPVKAKWFVLGYGAVELFLGVTGRQTGVAHFAHLGGMIFGYLLILYWTGRLPWKPAPGKLF